MDWFLKNLKAIVALVLPYLLNAGADLFADNAPWPQTGDEWLRYVGASLITAAGVYAARNKRDKDQVVDDLKRLPVSERKQALATVKSRYPHWSAEA